MEAIRDRIDTPVQPGLMAALGEVAVREATEELERTFDRYSETFDAYAAERGGNLPIPSGTEPPKHDHRGCLCGATPLERADAVLDWTARRACKAFFALENLRDPERYKPISARYRVWEWHVALVDPQLAERLTQSFPDASLDAYSTGAKVVSAVRARQGLDYQNPDDDVPVGRQTWGGVASPARAYRGLERSRNLDGHNADYIDAAALVDATLWDMPDWWVRVVAAKKNHKAKTGYQHLREAGFSSVEELFAAAGLTSKLRDALRLDADKRPAKGAALDLGINAAAYRQRVHDAKALLRKVLEPAADA
jgi:hypothetical protein